MSYYIFLVTVLAWLTLSAALPPTLVFNKAMNLRLMAARGENRTDEAPDGEQTPPNEWPNGSVRTDEWPSTPHWPWSQKRHCDAQDFAAPSEEVSLLDSEQPLKVLFIGNSLTRWPSNCYDLPAKFAELARSIGRNVEVFSDTTGGETLCDHCSNATSADGLVSHKFDIVVVQAASLELFWEYNGNRFCDHVEDEVGAHHAAGSCHESAGTLRLDQKPHRGAKWLEKHASDEKPHRGAKWLEKHASEICSSAEVCAQRLLQAAVAAGSRLMVASTWGYEESVKCSSMPGPHSRYNFQEMTHGIMEGVYKLHESLRSKGMNVSIVPYSEAALICQREPAFKKLWAEDGTCVHWGQLGAAFNAMTLASEVFDKVFHSPNSSSRMMKHLAAGDSDLEVLGECAARAKHASRTRFWRS